MSNRGSNVSELTEPVRCMTLDEVQQVHPFRKTDKKQPNGNGGKVRSTRRRCMADGCDNRVSTECFNEACMQRKGANGATGCFYCSEHFHIHWKHFVTTNNLA